jgi:hypothetical protein
MSTGVVAELCAFNGRASPQHPRNTFTDECIITEIHRLFGDSTPDGLSWQMREVKATGKKLKDAAAKGENPATALDGNLGSAVKRTPVARKRKAVIKPESDLDDLSEDEFTPTKAATKKARTTKAKAASVMAAAPSTPVHHTTAQAQPYTPTTSTTVAPNSAIPASGDLTEVAESAAATMTSPDTISRLGSMPAMTQGHGSPTELQSTVNTPGAFSAPYENGVSMRTILQPAHQVLEEGNLDPGNFGLSSGIGSAEQFNKGLSEIDQRYEGYMQHEPYTSAGLGDFTFDDEGAI